MLSNPINIHSHVKRYHAHHFGDIRKWAAVVTMDHWMPLSNGHWFRRESVCVAREDGFAHKADAEAWAQQVKREIIKNFNLKFEFVTAMEGRTAS